MARATARMANASLKGTPATAASALAYVENYNRLAKQAQEVTGGLDIPVFLPEDVARLQRAANPARRGLTSEPRRVASA
jgi:orotidine-5'-phosphate decarboxylase